MYPVYILIIAFCHCSMSVFIHCRALRAFTHVCISTESFQGSYPDPLNKSIYTIIHCAFISVHHCRPSAWATPMLGVVINLWHCGILPYSSSSSYLYQRMPMGLNISPSIWQSYINAILNCLQSRKYCETIMDDLILFTPSKESHMSKLEDILSALLKNGLKISPKKCQLFKTSLQYMGNEIFIENKKVCVKPLRNRLEAI